MLIKRAELELAGGLGTFWTPWRFDWGGDHEYKNIHILRKEE
jgi:hypothetical protein